MVRVEMCERRVPTFHDTRRTAASDGDMAWTSRGSVPAHYTRQPFELEARGSNVEEDAPTALRRVRVPQQLCLACDAKEVASEVFRRNERLKPCWIRARTRGYQRARHYQQHAGVVPIPDPQAAVASYVIDAFRLGYFPIRAPRTFRAALEPHQRSMYTCASQKNVSEEVIARLASHENATAGLPPTTV